jgi:hypothetical protein
MHMLGMTSIGVWVGLKVLAEGLVTSSCLRLVVCSFRYAPALFGRTLNSTHRKMPMMSIILDEPFN